jgi:hypothetical protein
MEETYEREKQVAKWNSAMDYFLGRCGVRRDMAEGLRLAADCRHEDAKWLMSLFPNGAPVCPAEAECVFAGVKDDARAMFFAAYSSIECGKMLRAATLGYAPAQAAMARMSKGADRHYWAEVAALQGDRNGLYLAALCCGFDGCDAGKLQALALCKQAAVLGHRRAQYAFGDRAFDSSNWERYHWWGLSAAQGNLVAIESLAEAAVGQLRDWEHGIASGRVLFEIGRVCHGQVAVRSGSVFGTLVQAAQFCALERSVMLFESWCMAARRAIRCWIWMSRQKGVVKDIRQLIAKILWAGRAAWSESSTTGSVTVE